MKIVARPIALAVVLSLALAGPLAPLASAQQPAEPKPDVMQEAMKASARTDPDRRAYDVGAGVANVFLVPGKTVICATSGVVSAAVMVLTLGSGYKTAAWAVREGCGGKCTVTGAEMRPEPDKRRPFDSETN